MRRYYIVLILIALFYSNNLYSQPPFEDDDFVGHHEKMMKKQGRMSEERIEKMMNALSTSFPEFYKKLNTLKESDPKVFLRAMHKLRKFMRNEKKGPEDKTKLIGIFTEEIEIDLLIEKYQNEKDLKKKEMIKAELLKKMSAIFDKKEDMKLEIINNVEKNLEKKRKDFDKRKRDKDNILKKDLEKMLQHRDQIGEEDEE